MLSPMCASDGDGLPALRLDWSGINSAGQQGILAAYSFDDALPGICRGDDREPEADPRKQRLILPFCSEAPARHNEHMEV